MEKTGILLRRYLLKQSRARGRQAFGGVRQAGRLAGARWREASVAGEIVVPRNPFALAQQS
jgi:hypothetical protein